MSTLYFNIGQLLTLDGHSPEKTMFERMNDLRIITDAVVIASETFEWIGTNSDYLKQKENLNSQFVITKTVDCKGNVVMPGFVDSHTHIVFAGNRSDEFARRLQGVSYTQIAAEGGGILSTMRAVRNAQIEELEEMGQTLATSAIKHGTTCIEIKSGYGLSLESELRQLYAIQNLRSTLPIHCYATYLGAHDFPPEHKSQPDRYVEEICTTHLPLIAQEKLATFCDVFTDTGYFNIEQSERILRTAQDYGFSCKVHADELSSFGAAELAGRLHATSADHLLYISEVGITSLKENNTVATLLPGTAYTLRLPYAPARTLIERGLCVALATDCNPGSCFIENMQVILSLACINMHMSIEEAITSATLHGAYALNQADRIGSITIGKSADFLILNTSQYSDLVYHYGINHVDSTYCRGRKIS